MLTLTKLLRFVPFFLVALFLTVACSDDVAETDVTRASASADEQPLLVDLQTALGVTDMTFSARYVERGPYELKSYGFAYSYAEAIPPFRVGVGSFRRPSRDMDEDGRFTYTATNVKKDSIYYVRAYAIVVDTLTDQRDTLYSDIAQAKLESVNPVLELMPVSNRARLGAVAFARFLSAGNIDLTKYGITYSLSPFPTANDDGEVAKDTCKISGYTGEFGAFFQTLQPHTLYYVRAYAIVTTGDTVYSNQRLFRTTEGGRYSWAWASNYNGAVSAGAADRISEAMDSAAYYYNNYSNLYLSAHVEYNTGVQTADCSYGGWIRFGANSRYQWVGTAQHETSHGLGVGTASNWKTLIDYSGTRIWQGACGQRTLRAVMHDQTQNLKGDNQHMWPGGINQREEVTTGTTNSYGESIRNERMLRGNAMICNALQIDGLYCP